MRRHWQEETADMSSEEPFATEAHQTDEQIAIDQERVDEERETSFQFQKEARDVDPRATTGEHAREGESAAGASAVAATSTEATEGGADGADAATVKEANTASGSKSSRSSRRSTASGAAEEEHARKRARKSTATTTASASTPASAPAVPDANVRLDRLRQALHRFLDLIEHRATRTSFAKALPHIDGDSIEALRQQFVAQLKEAIIDESEKLIESNELEAKLASLHRLAHEADARYHAGYAPDADETKDVWRKDLDLETAISARAIPDQQRRIAQLKAELDDVRRQNQAIHSEMLETRARCDAIHSDARLSLDALDSVSRHADRSDPTRCQKEDSGLTPVSRSLLTAVILARPFQTGNQGPRSLARHAEAAPTNHGRPAPRPWRSGLTDAPSSHRQGLLYTRTLFSQLFATGPAASIRHLRQPVHMLLFSVRTQ